MGRVHGRDGGSTGSGRRRNREVAGRAGDHGADPPGRGRVQRRRRGGERDLLAAHERLAKAVVPRVQRGEHLARRGARSRGRARPRAARLVRARRPWGRDGALGAARCRDRGGGDRVDRAARRDRRDWGERVPRADRAREDRRDHAVPRGRRGRGRDGAARAAGTATAAGARAPDPAGRAGGTGRARGTDGGAGLAGLGRRPVRASPVALLGRHALDRAGRRRLDAEHRPANLSALGATRLISTTPRSPTRGGAEHTFDRLDTLVLTSRLPPARHESGGAGCGGSARGVAARRRSRSSPEWGTRAARSIAIAARVALSTAENTTRQTVSATSIWRSAGRMNYARSTTTYS